MEEESEKSPFCYNFLLKERDRRVLVVTGLDQKTLTIGGSITVRLVSSLTGLYSAASLHTKNNIFYSLVKSSLAKLEPTSCTTYSDPSPNGKCSLARLSK